MSDDRYIRIIVPNPKHQEEVEDEIDEHPLPESPSDVVIIISDDTPEDDARSR